MTDQGSTAPLERKRGREEKKKGKKESKGKQDIAKGKMANEATSAIEQ
jgi:hypothetical protein